PRDAGVIVDKKEDKMGQRASNTATITFQDIEIPLDHLVGEENKGFKIAMMTLDRTRPGIAAMATGIARAAFEFATEYSKERVQLNQGVPRREVDARRQDHAALRGHGPDPAARDCPRDAPAAAHRGAPDSHRLRQ